MPSTANTHCPECGALVKPSDQQCWLCSLELQGRSLGASRPAKKPTFVKGPAASGSHPKPASAAAIHAPKGSPTNVPNPFADDAGEPRYIYKTNERALLGHLFAILAILPASGIAFLVTCSVAAESGLSRGRSLVGEEPNAVALIMALAAALVVFGGFCMLIVSLRKKTVCRVEIK